MTALAKAAEAFRTISEASSELHVPQHVLRHWEDVFGQIRPMRRAGGRRYYRPVDIEVLRGVAALLYHQRYTTKGVQKIFRDNGAKYVAEIGRLAAAGQPIELRPLVNEEADDREAAASAVDGVEPLPPAARTKLMEVLARLERAQRAIDDTVTALDAIDLE